MAEACTLSANGSCGIANRSWSDERGIRDRGDTEYFVYIAETTVLPSFIGFLCSTGLVGNILVLVTILRSGKKTVPDIYMCNLAVADLVHVTVMPFLIHQWARQGHWVFGSTLCTIITSLDTCNQIACIAIMTAMSVDRYLALVHPFRLMALRTRSKSIWINLFIWAASLILVLPTWVYSKVICFQDGLESCSFDLMSPHEVLWYTLYQSTTSFFLPLPLLLVSYILILSYTWRMYRQNNAARRYSSSVPRERVVRLTRTVLVLVGVFLVSVGPYHVIQLVNLGVARPTLTYSVCYYLSICLSYASSGLNPVIYILLSGHFRRRLMGKTTPSNRSTDRHVQNPDANTAKSSPETLA
ncbi:melanin-concentrating hormone receptor 2 [Megalops cyprinoides]|uniref:melanin-concentrating hormone receptor 2 n=1 Tax=Megalops cyprinoides TaxID=118141 RepID=UPI00186418F9|nr:melanin-concentrating hormone receptor 2 [Megalops cyprinoides]